jgi:integrase
VRLAGFRFSGGVAHLEIIRPGTNGRSRLRKTLRGVTKSEALAAWASLRHPETFSNIKTPSGTVPTTAHPFLGACLSSFIEGFDVYAGLAPKTVKTMTSMINLHIKPGLGHVKLGDIDTEALETFRAALRVKNAVYKNNIMRVVGKLLRLAVRKGVLSRCPEMPRPLRETRLRLEFSDDERKALLAAVQGLFPHAYGLFLAAFETGLSKCDLLTLRWDQVYLSEGVILRERAKTGVISRIPLSQACRVALESLQGRDGIVFRTPRGFAFSEVVVNRYFAAAKLKAGITRRVRFHDIRHSFGSRLASAGVPLLFIRDAMGHSDAKTTLRYARVDSSASKAILAALD